jgi:hypothetical protein
MIAFDFNQIVILDKSITGCEEEVGNVNLVFIIFWVIVFRFDLQKKVSYSMVFTDVLRCCQPAQGLRLLGYR